MRSVRSVLIQARQWSLGQLPDLQRQQLPPFWICPPNSLFHCPNAELQWPTCGKKTLEGWEKEEMSDTAAQPPIQRMPQNCRVSLRKALLTYMKLWHCGSLPPYKDCVRTSKTEVVSGTGDSRGCFDTSAPLDPTADAFVVLLTTWVWASLHDRSTLLSAKSVTNDGSAFNCLRTMISGGFHQPKHNMKVKLH